MTGIISPFNPHFALKWTSLWLKCLHFGYLLLIKMVPKPINGATVWLVHKTSDAGGYRYSFIVTCHW